MYTTRADDATTCYKKAIDIFLGLKAWEHAGDSIFNLAAEYHNRGDAGSKKQYLQQILEQYAKCKNPRNTA
jgi:hypothetical protein